MIPPTYTRGSWADGTTLEKDAQDLHYVILRLMTNHRNEVLVLRTVRKSLEQKTQKQTHSGKVN